MIVCKTKVTQGNMGSKWIFFIFTYFIFSINQKHTQISAEKESSDLEEEKSRELYMNQVSRLRKCSGKRTPEKVTCQQCIHILTNELSTFYFRLKNLFLSFVSSYYVISEIEKYKKLLY